MCSSDLRGVEQALAGEVGMSSELDEVARALFNGMLPSIWRRLAPDTLKSLGNWMIHLRRRHEQYGTWVGPHSHTQTHTLTHTLKHTRSDSVCVLCVCVFARWRKESLRSCGCQDSRSQNPT